MLISGDRFVVRSGSAIMSGTPTPAQTTVQVVYWVLDRNLNQQVSRVTSDQLQAQRWTENLAASNSPS